MADPSARRFSTARAHVWQRSICFSISILRTRSSSPSTYASRSIWVSSQLMPRLLGECAPSTLSATGFGPAPAWTSRFPLELPQPFRFLCMISLPIPAARSPPEILPVDHPEPGEAVRYRYCEAEGPRDWTDRCQAPEYLPPALPTACDFVAARYNRCCVRWPAARCARRRHGNRQRNGKRADTPLALRLRHRARCGLTSAPGCKRPPYAAPPTARNGRVCSVDPRKRALVSPKLARVDDCATGDFIPGNLCYWFHEQFQARNGFDAHPGAGRNAGRCHGVPDLATHQDLALRLEPRARDAFLADHPARAGQHLVPAGLDHNRNQKHRNGCEGDGHGHGGCEMDSNFRRTVDQEHSAQHHRDRGADAQNSMR